MTDISFLSVSNRLYSRFSDSCRLHGDSEIAARPTKISTRNLADRTDAGEISLVEWHSRSVHLALVGFVSGVCVE